MTLEHSISSSRVMHSYRSLGEARLTGLWQTVIQRACPGEVERIFASLLHPWGDLPLPSTPVWRSDIGDDHTPFEFSLAISGRQQELRILVEAQGDRATPLAYWEAGQALSRRLQCDHGVDLGRLHAVEDLFVPKDPASAFAVWHAVCLFPDRAPEWKVYLNPQARGREHAGAIVEEALVRLGYPRAWPSLSQIAGHRGPRRDELKYFSVDLSSRSDARAKVYFRHHDVTAGEIERSFAASRSYVPGVATDFIAKILRGAGPFTRKPIGSCFAFMGQDTDRPSVATLHLPVSHYASSDAVIQERLGGYLSEHGLSLEAYERATAAFATRPLADGVGMHSYASLRCDENRPRVTVYLAPELHRVAAPSSGVRMVAPGRSRARAEAIVELHEQESMAFHPLFQRLSREPVDLRKVWLLLANARLGIVQDFARRLASVVARTEDERLRSLLAKQLNDELGCGDWSRAHRLLFEKLLAGVDAWRPAAVVDAMLDPGRKLGERLEAIYSDPEPYVGVGAAMVLEIYGKQVDLQVGVELRRQKALDPASLDWLELHEELEIDHAQESMTMARVIAADGPELAATWRGAEAVSAASWEFFDAMYRLCFAEAA